MSRKRTCIEMDVDSHATKVYCIGPQQLPISATVVEKICDTLSRLEKTLYSLDQRVREQRYAMEGLKREVSALQTHAMHGAFAAQGQYPPVELEPVEPSCHMYKY